MPNMSMDRSTARYCRATLIVVLICVLVDTTVCLLGMFTVLIRVTALGIGSEEPKGLYKGPLPSSTSADERADNAFLLISSIALQALLSSHMT